MRKKIATLLLALVMCLSLCTPAMATKSPLEKSETADNTALVVSDDVTARIFGKYAKEIELIEDYAGHCMTHLTRDNLNVTKYVAALHHDDDEIVTHRTCFAVLYGTVVQTAFGRRYIDPDTATIVDYTLLASIGVPTYCGQARHGGTLYFSGPYAYRSAFESHPSPFI